MQADNFDRLHFTYKGRMVARTCWSCGASLSISDYNMIICERCEEPQPQDKQPTEEEAEDWRINGL